ncbi:hypothetical protein CKJ85_08405 [Corynebacterium sp. NML 150383]|uniref:hypothetical protein n=1 Tax=Corynebacterium sp. NML 150383 TaxID=2029400 RepID=UPI000BAA90BC|nr:hypothetical protein [Corynebacterium sp. NML 150383]PAT03391.1 hypothetical protein CKJ85_08405 [Corynebacterium sp. NML 150383]
MNRTSLAVAFAGALTFAAAPLASAQDLPAEVTDALGATYFLNQTGDHYVSDANLVATPYAQLSAGDQERAVDVTRAAVAGLIDAPAPAPSAPAAPADAPESQQGDQPATPVQPDEDQAPAEQVLDADAVDPNNPAPVAGGLVALPSVLNVDGQTYYLNKDGVTYVADVARVAETPTPEEAQASAQLVTDNAGAIREQGLEEARAGGKAEQADGEAAPAVEVQQQAAPVTADAVAGATEVQARGMAAETGSNTVARALVALLIASAVGAAVFVVGRRYLV